MEWRRDKAAASVVAEAAIVVMSAPNVTRGSRGGRTTKIHIRVDGKRKSVFFLLTGDERNDSSIHGVLHLRCSANMLAVITHDSPKVPFKRDRLKRVKAEVSCAMYHTNDGRFNERGVLQFSRAFVQQPFGFEELNQFDPVVEDFEALRAERNISTSSVAETAYNLAYALTGLRQEPNRETVVTPSRYESVVKPLAETPSDMLNPHAAYRVSNLLAIMKENIGRKITVEQYDLAQTVCEKGLTSEESRKPEYYTPTILWMLEGLRGVRSKKAVRDRLPFLENKAEGILQSEHREQFLADIAHVKKQIQAASIQVSTPASQAESSASVKAEETKTPDPEPLLADAMPSSAGIVEPEEQKPERSPMSARELYLDALGRGKALIRTETALRRSESPTSPVSPESAAARLAQTSRFRPSSPFRYGMPPSRRVTDLMEEGNANTPGGEPMQRSKTDPLPNRGRGR